MKTLREASNALKRQYEAAERDYFSFGCFRDAVFLKNGTEKEKYFMHPDAALSDDDYNKILSDGCLLLDGYPLQYYLGTEEFCGIEFSVSENVLIPRKETQIISQYAIDNLAENSKIADLCCGSGCISLSVLYHRKDIRAYAADISEHALKLTEENAELLGVSERVDILKCDILDKSDTENFKSLIGYEALDAVLSNPPYIKSAQMNALPENVKREPAIALDGGVDGVDFYGSIADISHSILKKSGFLFVECGWNDEDLVIDIVKKRNFSAEIKEKQFILFTKR